jgi:Uma2 family endonuclease
MATITPAGLWQPNDAIIPLPSQEHVLLRGISWDTYEAILREMEGRRRLRLTYDDGDLEIMSPSNKHEWGKTLLARMVEAYTEELGIPICSAGSTTFKLELERKGLEADECYYLQHEELVRAKDELNLGEDPPPDLAIEIEVTARVLKRLPIYAGLRFPEVWQFSRGEIKVHLLGSDGFYAVGRTSACLPQLPLVKLEEFLRKRGQTDETTWIRAFRQWVRTTIS